MRIKTPVALLTIGALAFGTIALAQSAEDAIKLRKSHMTLVAANLGVLGGMARGDLEYDAVAAQAAADNLAAVAGLDQSRYWPEGSAQGEVEGTRALAAIWEDPEGYAAANEALAVAAVAMAEVAGAGLEPMQAAMGPLGATCGGCHEDYRGER